MKSTFKITYRPSDGSREYVSRLIDADDVDEAREAILPCHSIRSISVQCHGKTQKGSPCQRFTANEYCCDAHDPRSARAELSFDCDAELFFLIRMKGSTHYSTTELDVQTVREAFERNEMITRYPRTQMIDRLISLDWDVEALRQHYADEEARMSAERRREKFRVRIEKNEPGAYDESTLRTYVTRNGFQWFGIDFTDEEARCFIEALQEVLDTDPADRFDSEERGLLYHSD